MDKIKLLIADDHPMMREALLTALADETDMKVVGEASDGMEAIKMERICKPDLILMDLLMPGMNGMQAIDQILEVNPQAKILVITSLEDEDMILAAIQAGALGYFPKTAPRQYLLEAIRMVADGVPYLPSGIMAKLFHGIHRMKVPVKSTVDEPLTARQQEILVMMGEGCSDHAIAQKLQLEEATVRSHIHHILQRIGVENRAQAVAYVNRHRRAQD